MFLFQGSLSCAVQNVYVKEKTSFVFVFSVIYFVQEKKQTEK